MDKRVCTFDEATHTYYLDGVKMISVTQLLTEQNIKADISKAPVNQKVLQDAIERGLFIHEEIELFVNNGIEGISPEFEFFKNEVYPLRDQWKAEVTVYCDDYCGRMDLLGTSEGKPALVIDNKTGSSWTKEDVAWQNSLYARCLPELIGDDAEMKCLDLKNLKLVDLERIPEKEIKKLIKCHKTGKIYQKPQLLVPSDSVNQMLALETAVTELETAVKTLTEKRDAMREEFRKLFEEQGVEEFSSPLLKVVYFAPSKIEGGIDKDKLQKDYPEAYKACKKADSPKKDYVKVYVRSAS